MRKSLSQSSMSLLPTLPPSPHSRPPPRCCSPTAQQRLAKLVLAALGLAALVLLYLIANATSYPSLVPAADASTVTAVQPSSLLFELPPLPISPHPASRWSDLTPPLTRESLGQATWSFLHTLAAVYPTQPNELEQRSARQLLEAIGWLYPCAVCAEHFRSTLTVTPPRVGSRLELSDWLCEAHNEVNNRLDKPKSVAHEHHIDPHASHIAALLCTANCVVRSLARSVSFASFSAWCRVDCSTVGALWPPELRECGCGPEDLPGNSTATSREAG